MMENTNLHDHWVEAVGDDTITDFSRAEGDSIEITGHTVAFTIEYAQIGDDMASIIHLFSDQAGQMAMSGMGGMGGMGGMAPMAHDQDQLGTITVYGDQITADDITLNAHVWNGVGEVISGLWGDM